MDSKTVIEVKMKENGGIANFGIHRDWLWIFSGRFFFLIKI